MWWSVTSHDLRGCLRGVSGNGADLLCALRLRPDPPRSERSLEFHALWVVLVRGQEERVVETPSARASDVEHEGLLALRRVADVLPDLVAALAL